MATYGEGSPESVSVQTGSYVVPVGKYVLATISLSANAAGAVRGSASSPSPLAAATSNDSKTVTMRFPAGTTLNVSTSNASASTTATDTQITGTTTASFTVGGTTAIQAQAYVVLRTGADAGQNAVISGASDARYIVQVYAA